MYHNLYCSDFRCNKIVFAPDRVAHCFFIVNYLHKREVIRDQAEYYLNSQCRNYEFFGEYSAQWELIFDDVDIDLHPDVDSDDIALTMAWEKMDCFVDALALELAISGRAESNMQNGSNSNLCVRLPPFFFL